MVNEFLNLSTCPVLVKLPKKEGQMNEAVSKEIINKFNNSTLLGRAKAEQAMVSEFLNKDLEDLVPKMHFVQQYFLPPKW